MVKMAKPRKASKLSFLLVMWLLKRAANYSPPQFSMEKLNSVNPEMNYQPGF
jgi:hypothetical protein